MYEIDKSQISIDLKELADRAEPAFEEFRTSAYLKERLSEMGISIDKEVRTGFFGTINTDSEITVALRADMDALPFNEDRSEYKHLCGHHANMTTLLTSLSILNKIKNKLNVNVRFIFQPAEELVSGSEVMIDGGCLEGVSEILATHTSPDVDLGQVALISGGCMAGSNHFDITFKGKSTHAAMPHTGSDVVTAACDFVSSAHMIISRLKNPVESGLISFGSINGGSAANILPEEVKVMGTYRHFDKHVKEIIEKGMADRLAGINAFYGVEGELDIHDGTPPVICDKGIVADLRDICMRSGMDISPFDSKVMGGEDFAFYLEHVPGAFIWQGVRSGDSHPPLHNKAYTVPDDAVLPGIKLLTEYILSK